MTDRWRSAPRTLGAHASPDAMSTPADQTTPDSNARKDPDAWTTGDEAMTGAQQSYLHTLAQEADEDPASVEDLTKAEASKEIERLQDETGRGQ